MRMRGGIVTGSIAALVSGCSLALAPALALLPLVPVAAPAPYGPTAHVRAGGARVTARNVDGGGVAEVTSTMIAGQPVGLAGYSHLELGSFGKDGWTGAVDGELGVGAGAPGARFALVTGFAYGGYPQNGKSVPLRAIALVDTARVAFEASGYVGWRFNLADELPPATRTLGPWNTWGGRLEATFLKIGPSLGVSWDRQDDITTFGVHVGVGVHAH